LCGLEDRGPGIEPFNVPFLDTRSADLRRKPSWFMLCVVVLLLEENKKEKEEEKEKEKESR
jgi:hypothetical protein